MEIFIIVLLFNIYWISKGFNTYLSAYKWSESRWLSVFLISYNLYGIGSLIYYLNK